MQKGLILDMINVTNIQRVCFHDGPGIRTTVFLNFCMLKCPWCANPETSKINIKYFLNDNCKKDKCPFGINCSGIKSNLAELEKNYKECPVGAIEKIQSLYSIEELYNILITDEFLYKENGGITFSGGEPLLQSEELNKLIKKLKKRNINIAIETSLFAPTNKINLIIDDIDLFIIDIKILNKQKCLDILKGDLDLFFENIDIIFNKHKNVIFRIPLISPYITDEDNIRNIYNFLKKYKPKKVEIFKGHNLAKSKYIKFGMEYEEVHSISDENIESIKIRIESIGIETELISY